MSASNVKDEFSSITRESIFFALIKLLKERPSGNISVTELCKLAGVSRMSYYRHYTSFDDIIHEHLAERPIGFDPDLKPEDFDPYEHSRASFQYFYDERDLMETIIDSEYQRVFIDFCNDYFHNQFRDVAKALGFTERYDLSALAGMYVFTIMDWVRNGYDVSVEEMARFGELIFKRFSYGIKETQLKAMLRNILN